VKNNLVSLLFLFVFPISLIAENAMATEEKKVKYYKKPLREFSIILTDEGYYPNRLVTHAGDKVRFFVTSTSSKSECLIVQDHKIFLSANKGEVSEGETTFNEAGKYKFYCPSSKHKGFITVLEKEDNVEEQTRKVASDKPNYWLPRDYD
jgi:plastocyanin